MNWDAVGAIGEIIGAAAVVATLGYLAFQIRSAHRVATDTNRHARAAAVRDGLMAFVHAPELRVAWVKAFQGDSAYQSLAEHVGLTTEEAFLVDMYLIHWVYVHWPQHYSALTDYDRKELDTLIGNFYSTPPITEFLKRSPYRNTMDPKFLEYIEKIVASGSERAGNEPES